MDSSFDSLISRLNSATQRHEIVAVLKDSRTLCTGEASRNVLNSNKSVGIYRSLIRRFNQPFLGCLKQSEYREFLEGTFLNGPPVDSFLCLEESLSDSEMTTYKLEKILSLLDIFSRQGFPKMFLSFSLVNPQADKDVFCKGTDQIAQLVAQRIVSLPDKIAKICHGANVSKDFGTEPYLRHVAVAATQTLEEVHSRIVSGTDSSLQFLSLLLPKLFLAGYGHEFLKILLPWLGKKCRTEDFTWRRISQRLLTRDLPWNAAEGFLMEVLSLSRSEDLDGLLGDSICENKQMEFLFTNKLFLRCSVGKQSHEVPDKIASYFASGSKRRVFLGQTLLRLMEVWADSGALVHTSVDQQRYVSRSILCLVEKLTDEEKETLKESLMKLLMNGMQIHLASASKNVRTQGMVVGEMLTRAFDPSSPSLDFKCDKDEDESSVLLRKVNPENVPEDSLASILMEDDKSSESLKKIETAIYDSDDDFEPYDLPEEETQQPELDSGNLEGADQKKPRSPVYIRDCFEGLVEDKDYRKFESCFFAAEKLIRKEAVGFREIAEELTKRLINLEDRFSTDNFETVRQSCVVACCVMKPKSVAKLLATEFYQRNYTIGQRMLMLDVICDSVKELTNLSTKEKKGGSEERKTLETLAPPSEFIPSWRLEIEKRVATKTRRFSSKKRTEASSAVPNKFANLAPDFFFPLISGYDGKNSPFLDLLGRDYFVMGRLLYVLGTITFSAQNAPSILTLSETLVASLWTLRFHDQSFVRQGVIFSFSMVILSLPSQLISLSLRENLSELRDWLVMTSEKDPDTECRRMAENTLGLLAFKLTNQTSSGVVALD